ncbi:MAG TPA: ABC transporter permease [Candidatus Polarisedimenticolia bacterium]|jgi:putative ABC transport system permease protein|nr:ABC transporter permease [Candidatus Polarisedimenticolia bacterium]
MSAVPGFFRLATSDLRRRPLRTGLAILGVALSTGLLLGTLSMHAGYVRALDSTIDRMGYQVLVTAKGCPYEAASLMMRGGNTPMTIDESTFDTILQDADVSEATRIFMQSMPAGPAGKNMVFLGVDDRYRRLKPWMTLQRGEWFSGPEAPEALLGYNASLLLGLKLGDSLSVGPTHKPLVIRGVFDRSGTQEDGMVIIPLLYSQELFDRQGKLTGVGVRLKSLDKVQGFLQRMFDLPSVQAITMTQFRTTVLEFVATSRLLLLLSALVASVIGGLGVLNAMTMTVSERVREFGLMKAVGASPRDLFTLTLLETGVLGLLGGIVGAAVTAAGGLGIESLIRQFVPFVPPGAILATSLPRALACVVASLSLAVVAGIYPAARAAVVRPARVLGRAG